MSHFRVFLECIRMIPNIYTAGIPLQIEEISTLLLGQFRAGGTYYMINTYYHQFLMRQEAIQSVNHMKEILQQSFSRSAKSAAP